MIGLPKNTAKLSFFLRILAGAGFFFILFKYVPYADFAEILRLARLSWVVWAIAIFFCAIPVGILRWQYFLKSLGRDVSFGRLTYVYFSADFLNFFVPSGIAGELFRFASTSGLGEASRAASSLLMDRFCGFTATVLFAAVFFIFNQHLRGHAEMMTVVIFTALMVLVAALGIFSKRVFMFLIKAFKSQDFRVKLIKFHDQLYFFRLNPGVFVRGLVFSFGIQVLCCLGFYVSALAFGLTGLSIFDFFVLAPLITLAAFVPVTIAGAGTREAAAVYLFSLIGISKEIGLAIALVHFLFWILCGLTGGIVYVLVPRSVSLNRQ